ncbi:MAG: aldehyde ferredoxin oxidoreductase family protein [Candidatus Atribacteria bacterium]|nr:aldehyde ferredoxin oxidoreductase family protein [Candidatus Atribacteria bacterium]
MAQGGFMGKYLLVDLGKNKIEEFDFNNDVKRNYYGGYGIGCKYIYENQKPGIDPLGEENILAFMTGPCSGTTIPGTSKYTICGKSPLTKAWGDSNCGGSFGPRMKMAGADGVFFTGKSEKPVYLLIDNGIAKLVDARDLWGKDTYEVDDIIRERYGKNAEAAIIGQGGEMKTLISCIVNRKGKVAGRSGMGAIMGSKNLKAVVAIGNKKVPIANKQLFEEARKQFLEDIKNDYGDAEWAKHGGTPTVIESGIDEQDSPIKNWSGVTADMGDYSVFKYDNIKKYIVKRETCQGCPIACWDRSMLDKGKYAIKEPSHIPEYETTAMFGALCLNTNYESIIKCNDLCNRYGIDTISTGGIVAFAIECYENCILTKKDTDGLELTWGNHQSIVALTKKIAKREGIGEVLADGVKSASEKIGKGSEEFAIHIGGQELPAHDTRWDPSLAIIYSIDPTPGRHMQTNQNLGHKNIDKIFPNIDFSTCAGKNRKKFSGRAGEIKVLSSLVHSVNTLGLCLFAWGSTDILVHVKYLAAITGFDLNIEEFTKTGERIMNLRQAFNLREGINQLSYKIPGRVLGKPPLHNGKTKGIVIDYVTMLREFYAEVDWDLNTSKPSKKKLKELDLGWIINDIYK